MEKKNILNADDHIASRGIPEEVKVDYLRQEFNKAKWIYEDEDAVLQNDMTEKFLLTLKSKLSNKERVPITILGEPRMGKSTLMMWILWYENMFLMYKKKFLQESEEKKNYVHHDWKYQIMDWEGQPFAAQKKPGTIIKKIRLFDTIASEQSEYIRMVFDDKKDLQNCALGIDEYNRLSTTGEGAMAESVYFNQFSDMYASRFIHSVMASPTDVIDKNSMIIITIESREKGVTVGKLYYKDIVTKGKKLLGSITIDVSNIIHQPFYMRYREKKDERQSFTMKHKIKDVRTIEAAQIILATYIKVKPYAEEGSVERDFIKTTAEDEERRLFNLQTSMLGAEKYVNGVVSIMTYDRQIQKLKAKQRKKGTSMEEKERIQQKIIKAQHDKKKKIKKYTDMHELWIQYTRI